MFFISIVMIVYFSVVASASTTQEEPVSNVDSVQLTGTSIENDSATSENKKDNLEESEKASSEDTKTETG